MFDLDSIPLNVLQMLSSKEKPHPFHEIDWHCRRWEETREPTYIATVRPVRGLLEEVSYYGDSAMRHILLATGNYYGYVDKDTKKGQVLANSGIYGDDGLPLNVRGFIGVTDLQRATPRQSIATLQARMRAQVEKIVKECAGIIEGLDITTFHDLITHVQKNSDMYEQPIRQLDGKSIKVLYDNSFLDRKNLPRSGSRMVVYYYKLRDLGEAP